MGFQTPGFLELNNLFETIQWSNPPLAQLMHKDMVQVSLGAISGDLVPAYEVVRNLRKLAEGLPMAQSKMLDYALKEMGYFLGAIYEEHS